jgi:hypothetical protein
MQIGELRVNNKDNTHNADKPGSGDFPRLGSAAPKVFGLARFDTAGELGHVDSELSRDHG